MKKTIYLLMISAFLAVSTAISADNTSGLYIPGRIYAKFKSGSPEANEWLSSGRKSEIKSLTQKLGKCSVTPFVRDELITLVNQAQNQNNKLVPTKPIEGISLLIIIDYSSAISPEKASRLAAELPYFEYAEPAPIIKTSIIPNDSLFYDEWYIRKIKADSAWGALYSPDSVLVGIVDTGVDYTHEDLSALIWSNPGETGLDSNGIDKRTNGKDDDHNGFIDDWRGWDFVSSDDVAISQDNDPFPGAPHGTHVAGIVGAQINNYHGIAGVGKYIKFLPVKIGYDNPLSGSVTNSYEGVLYAAAIGAKVINCSWGSSSKSETEGEMIRKALEFGTVIVAAAGNDGRNTPYFPAAYPGVMSVAATDSNDSHAYFTNYHSTVDISAPGMEIMSCIPYNEYRKMDGTSMASPVVAGAATMVILAHPDYNYIQVIEHLKSTSDNIDSLNQFFIGNLGRGRVNVLNAVSTPYVKAISLLEWNLKGTTNNGYFEPGEQIELTLNVQNVLSPVRNAFLKVIPTQFYSPVFDSDSIYLGDMATLESKQPDTKIVFRLALNTPLDYSLTFAIESHDSSGKISIEYISFNVNPSYRTFSGNNISVTVNSSGNIAYNDYPGNMQGEGFKYKNGSNLLYEGALMIATSKGIMSDCARGNSQAWKDADFIPLDIIERKIGQSPFSESGDSRFTDYNGGVVDSAKAKVDVISHFWQFADQGKQDYAIIAYDIVNRTGEFKDSVFASMFLDWDIGPSGQDNQITFDEARRVGIIRNVAIDTLPIVGMAMISAQELDFFAIDNDASTVHNPGVWDGFPKSEKYYTMSGGIARKKSNVTDVSLVIGAGPMRMKDLDTLRVAYVIAVGKTQEDVFQSIENARKTASDLNLDNGRYLILPISNSVSSIYPNPAINKTTAIIEMRSDDNVTLEVFDLAGNNVPELTAEKLVHKGRNYFDINCATLAIGVYYVRMTDSKGNKSDEPFIIAR